MKRCYLYRNFTESTRAIHLRSSLASLSQPKFWFAKKLKMNLRIALTVKSFCKLSRPCKNSLCFQKMVQLFNLMRIMLLAQMVNTSWRNAGKQQLEIIFQTEIIRDQILSKSAFIRRNSTALSKSQLFLNFRHVRINGYILY